MIITAREIGTFGALLRQHRVAASLSQQRLGERAGLSPNAIAALERGRRIVPRPRTVSQLADALRLSPTERLAFIGAAKPGRLPAFFESQPMSDQTPRLSVPLTSFVGRERLADLKRLLSSRLLTLTGTGGIGKTRLAIELARVAESDFPGGVCVVELATLTDPALVVASVATTIGIGERPEQALPETLAQFLHTRRLLLVMDNCEHVVQACAELADYLLRVAPDVHILATSREALGVAGEVVWQVPTLQLPEDRARPSRDHVGQSEAVQLFIDRAYAATSSFELNEHNAEGVATVCRRLEGLPLAIELAAARLAVLSLEQIAERLDDELRLLASGPRSTPPRHRTLRATLDWSYSLLTPNEQLLFDRLAVFVGGFTVEAAEAVCAGSGIESRDVLDLLTRLVSQSLVLVVWGDGVAARYRLLEPLGQYATERLDERNEAEVLRRAHANYFVACAEQAGPQLRGPAQRGWLARLLPEHDNFRAALRWCVDRSEEGLGLQIAGALWSFWYSLGHVSEGLGWLRTSLACQTAAHPELRARALLGAGQLALLCDLFEPADAYLAESLSLWREMGDQRGIAETLRAMGTACLHQGENDQAEAFFDETLALFHLLSDDWGIASCMTSLGNLAYARHDYAQAALRFEDCLWLARQQGDIWRVAGAMQTLGHIAWAQGDQARAGVLLAEGLAVSRELDDRRGMAVCLESLALVAGSRGQPVRAARLFGAAATLRAEVGVRWRPWLRADFERCGVAIRTALGESAFEAARIAGSALTREEAFAEALIGSGPEPRLTQDGTTRGCAGSPVTPREREVARLVARGLTNRQIGEMLVISAGTANLHVKHLLSKLGFASRVEIATWVVAGGVLSTDSGISRTGDGVAVGRA